MDRKPAKRDVDVDSEKLPQDALDEILAVARKRAELVGQMKKALIEGNTDEVTRIAAVLCGVDPVRRTA